ncbi:GGDEF domain-containing protein [Pseudonocardiaceae bacterium YIM PH 21723]|nr:GGDEF domain-containing protein [Pseudonocardiaceae bacterium YIM PH 21723]
MSVLRPESGETSRSGVPSYLDARRTESANPTRADITQREADYRAGLIELHQSMAERLASQNQWQQAYHHLRSALDLTKGGEQEPPRLPEQLRREVDRLRQQNAEAVEQSIRDSLTATYNRRYLDQNLRVLLADPRQLSNGLGLALVDLDWFKQVNDTYGHLIGDRVLRRVVELLQQGLPGGGFCARYGGDEFALVLPNTCADEATLVCETARDRVERYPWAQIAPDLRVTVSIGIAHEPGRHADSMAAPEQQLLRADTLLYAVKQAGRNAVAYRVGGEVRLAGAAGGRRAIAQTRVVGLL